MIGNKFMKIMNDLYLALFSVFIGCILLTGCSIDDNYNYIDDPRTLFGKAKLTSALEKAGLSNSKIKLNLELNPDLNKAESYSINLNDSVITIAGSDAAGLLYGCLDLSASIKRLKNIPENFSSYESPVMSLRGVCILLMKLGTYNYPVTPQEFPFFYDKKLWIEYLDFLAANKYNYIAFWNGHPFAYFTKLDKYPEAQEGMPPGLVERNNKMLHWLLAESKKRNIKLIFQFYNIHTSVYFQKAHNLPDQFSEPSPLLADYTSYCIEKFVTEFPDVGLYITAGEALDPQYAVQWVNHVVLDAVKKSGKQPQIILRSWFLDFENAKKILDYYPGIFIERKYNVEMIADTLIDPQNKLWADLSGNYIVNIHMAANLEPFRWNPPNYIQKCMQSAVSIGANGLHLYPRKSWRWPYGADTGKRQLQWERDKLWFEMWARYAWNPDRKASAELDYWLEYFTTEYGSQEAATLALSAFETNADVLPAIQRLFWAGYDNHTVVTSGLMLSRIERLKGIPFLSLDPVIRIPKYLEMTSKELVSEGISPVEFLDKKVADAETARRQLENAVKHARKNIDKLKSHLADAKAVELTVKFYSEKLKAAVTKAELSANPDDKMIGDKFLKYLNNSVTYFKKLTVLTEDHYESISDVSALHPLPLKVLPFHWADILPLYIQEYQVYADEIQQKDQPEVNIPKFMGLIGVCYGSPDLVNPRKVLNTETLDFDWDINPPDDGRNWSASFSGFIKAPVTGDIKFYVSSRQSVKLVIDKKIVVNKNDVRQEEIATVYLNWNKWYPLIIEYDNIDFRGSNLKIYWSWPGVKKSSISREYLMHSEYNNKKANRTLVLGF